MRSWKSANYGKQEQHDERWWRVPRKIVGERGAELASISEVPLRMGPAHYPTKNMALLLTRLGSELGNVSAVRPCIAS